MLAFIILAIINTIILLRTGQAGAGAGVGAGAGAGNWTVFGTMGCTWTRKQLDYMKKAGKAHTFVDCDKEGCGGMDAYPTLMSPEGEKTVGYKEV